MLIWVIGMSGAGKTTIGEFMLNIMQRQYPDKKWVLLDGDSVRSRFDHTYGHDIEGRMKNSQNMVQLCKEEIKNGNNVIAFILSIFPEQQLQNRIDFVEYKEIYVKVSLKKLKQRDNKGLYYKAENNLIDNVVGIQIPFPEPLNPDYILDNEKDNVKFVDLASEALKGIGLLKNTTYSYTKNNLLNNPIKYQYTEYEGKDFLKAYLKNRNRFLQKISPNMLSKKPFSCSIENHTGESNLFFANYNRINKDWIYYFEKNLKNTNEISKTRSKLIGILNQLNNRQLNTESEQFILRLVQKFEVSKKLFDCYNWDTLKKRTEDSTDLFNYPLFGVILSFYILEVSDDKKNIYRNTHLKINDIIVSANHFLNSTNLKSASCISVALEIYSLEDEIHDLLS